MAKLGYLSPRIVESMFKAKHSDKLKVIALEKIADVNIDWNKQEMAFAEYR